MVRELCDVGMVERIMTNGAINIADELTNQCNFNVMNGSVMLCLKI